MSDPRTRFRGAIELRILWGAEDAARELGERGELTLRDALDLVHLYGYKESPKYERAARRWLVRYLTEDEPSLRQLARITDRLAQHAAWRERL